MGSAGKAQARKIGDSQDAQAGGARGVVQSARVIPAFAYLGSLPAGSLAQDIVRIVDGVPHCRASED